MTFISFEFACFFFIVTLFYFLLPARARGSWLFVSSAVFYGWSGPIYLIQLLTATVVVFVLGRRIEHAPDKHTKRRYVALGVLALVANLLTFKYAAFVNETFRGLFGYLGVAYSLPDVSIALPVGISFYTLLLIGYLVDVFRGGPAEQDAGTFALYTTFFPKLVAGPIERPKHFLPQLRQPPGFDYARVVAGLQLMAWGVFKKTVIADRIAPFVEDVYGNPSAHDGVTMTLATWLYAFQLYADFSGYTDVAIGAALVLGFTLVTNFNRPYFATSIQDFWKRWHMSLTSWLTDYVFTPLTRQRRFKLKFFTMILLGLFLTFVTSGLWHGPRWTYVLWGALHGLYIVVALLLQKPTTVFVRAIRLDRHPQLYRCVNVGVTFSLVCLAYVLFRANSIDDAGYIFAHLLSGWGNAAEGLRVYLADRQAEFVIALAGIAVLMGVDMLGSRIDVGTAIAARPPWARWSIYSVGVASILILGAFYDSQYNFIYFRF